MPNYYATSDEEDSSDEENGLHPFLHPRRHTAVNVQVSYKDPLNYLKHVQTNVLAEFWEMFKHKSGHWPGWCQKHLDVYTVPSPVQEKFHSKCFASAKNGKSEECLDSLDKHLCVYAGSLWLSSYFPNNQLLKLSRGSALEDYDMQDRYASQEDKSHLYSYGYIGDAIREFTACQNLQNGHIEMPSILYSIADPSGRQPELYKTQGISADVPINETQQGALAQMAYDIEGIQGPPGTGKSTTIFHLVNSFTAPTDCVLALCVQNRAIDAIAEKFSHTSEKLSFFVIGNEDRIGETAAEWTLTAQVNRNPEVVALKNRCKYMYKCFSIVNDVLLAKLKLTKQTRTRCRAALYRKRLQEIGLATGLHAFDERIKFEEEWDKQRDGWAVCWEAYVHDKYAKLFQFVQFVDEELHRLWQELDHLRMQLTQELISTTRAVLCTVQTASSSRFHSIEMQPARKRISTVVIDEAGTVPEAKMVLVSTLCPSRIVAIGDQKQLAPFTHMQDCKPMGYFHRLSHALEGHEIPSLCMQYRMHPVICKMVSKLFYNDKLQTDAHIAQQRMEAVASEAACLWMETPWNTDEQPQRSKSWHNETEVENIMWLLETKPEWFQGKDVMIMSFYKPQVQLLKDSLMTLMENPDVRLRIVTADASQGSEADIVLLSCVRSSGKLGFLGDKARTCVSISRAKERLVVFGNKRTLTKDPKWKRIHKATEPLNQ